MTSKMTERKRIPLVLIISGMIFAMLGGALAQRNPGDNRPRPIPSGKPTEIVMKRGASSTLDLRRLPQTRPDKRERPEREDPEIIRTEIPSGTNLPPRVTTQSVQALTAPAPGTTLNFDGLDFANWGAGHPPDTNGDVGPTYYIQTINNLYWDLPQIRWGEGRRVHLQYFHEPGQFR